MLRQENRGVPAAVNRAISIARSDLIARMDSDDRMLPDRLERQLKFLAENPDAAVVCGHAYLISASGKRVGKARTPVDVERGKRELAPERFVEIIQSTVLMRKQDVLSVGGYREDITYSEDRELWGRIVTSGRMIRCQQEFLLDFRLHSGAMSMQKALRNSTTCKFIDLNIVRSLRGKPHLSYDELDRWYKSLSVWQRINDRKLFLALFHFKNASRHFAEREWFPFLYSFGIAVTLRPLFILHRVASKLA